jgi:glycosyltransferase involved in cell wall biosynthesis
MRIKTCSFTLPHPLYYAWLLRSDVRGDTPVDNIEGQKGFLVWWVLSGVREYGQTVIFDDSQKTVLFEPLPNDNNHKDFQVCRLLKRLLQIRTDVTQQFDLSSEQGFLKTQAWFYVYGLREHLLLHLVDDATLRWLDETPTFLKEVYLSSANGEPEISRLMFFVWQSQTELQKKFDLTDSGTRQKFIYWFFIIGLHEVKLHFLISDRWRQWLSAKIIIGVKNSQVTRIAAFLWQSRIELQYAFDLSVPEGCKGFDDWCMATAGSESALRWLALRKDCGMLNALMPALVKPRIKLKPKFGVNLIGFAFGELGIGEDVRMAASACDAAQIPYSVINLSLSGDARQADEILADQVSASLGQPLYPINIFCLTGFDTARAYLEYGDKLFSNRHNIGWWPWELAVWPNHWSCAFALVDEVWAATEFTRTMYERVSPVPVSLMPLPVSVGRVESITRQSFGLPVDSFIFLYVFDFNSYLMRKNPLAVVDAFRKAFSAQDKTVSLVLKTMNSNPANPLWQAFKKCCFEDKRIILMECTLDRPQVLGLIQACDVYVSLHRSEGFGRTLAEAMLFGKPVVATDYSGNRDFLTVKTGFPVNYQETPVNKNDYPFVENGEAVWANPDIEHAAYQMNRALDAVCDDDFTNLVRVYAMRQFSSERIGHLMHNYLTSVFSQVTAYPA